MVRAQLSPLSRREAKRLAGQLATLCQTVCVFAADIWKGMLMDPSQTDDRQNELIQHTVAACQNAISRVLENLSQAIGLARGLNSALISPQLVGREVGKGQAGVTANAEALTRAALTDVLKLAPQPDEPLAAVEHMAPSIAPAVDPPPAVPTNAATGRLPLFSAISRAHIDMREERDGDHADNPMLILRRQVFIDAIGDGTPDTHFLSDLQAFVNRMQYWPANDPAAERKAALAFETEQRRRQRERAKEDMARQKERERRQHAVDKAQSTLDTARKEHEETVADAQTKAVTIEKRSQVGEAHWAKEKPRLETALRRART